MALFWIDLQRTAYNANQILRCQLQKTLLVCVSIGAFDPMIPTKALIFTLMGHRPGIKVKISDNADCLETRLFAEASKNKGDKDLF